MKKEQIKAYFEAYRGRLIKCQTECSRALQKRDAAARTKSPALSDMPRMGASDLKDLGNRVADYLDDIELVRGELATLQEIEEQLKRLLWTLPSDYSDAIKLLYLQGYSIKEAAQKTVISQSGFKMRIFRGFEVLAKKWTEVS